MSGPTLQHFMVAATHLVRNEKIQAIKEVRSVGDISLKEAKDLVDSVATPLGATYPPAEEIAQQMWEKYHGKAYSASLSIEEQIDTESMGILQSLTLALQMMVKEQRETNELLRDLVEALDS